MDAKIVAESVQQYNLKWTNYTNNLSEIFVDHLNKGFLTDVSLCCEGTLIRVHKMVLAACSSYFEHLFQIYTEHNPLIILNGVQLKDLNMLIQFMYRGEIRVPENEIQNILKLSTDLQVKGLSEIKSDFISNKKANVSSTNVEKQDVSSIDAKDKHADELLTQKMNNSDNAKQNTHIPLTPIPATQSLQPQAFMIFANITRNKLKNIFPNEQAKDISVRISTLWKKLPTNKKKGFLELAKKNQNEMSFSSYTSQDTGSIDGSKRKRIDDDIKLQELSLEGNLSSTDEDDDIEFVDDSKGIPLSEIDEKS